MAKWLRFSRDGAEEFGTLEDGTIAVHSGDMFAGAQATGETVALADVEVLTPCRPSKMICLWNNFHELSARLGTARPADPLYFLKAPNAFLADGQVIHRPKGYVGNVIYEGELGVIIGKSGRHIPKERALDYVAGYTIINEGTVRDWLRRGTQNFPGKNFYRSGAIGPWMVTADEIADLSAVPIVTRVDGEVRQDGMTDMMIFDIPFVISHISTFTWLEPGDMIATGSPGGSAIESDPPAWLRPGQEIEIEIAPIGVLRNRVEAEPS